MKKRKLMPPSPLPSGQFAARVVPAVQDCGGQGREQVWPGREGHGQGVHRARRHGDPRALACHDGEEAQQEPVREDHGQGAVQHVRFDAVQRARFELGNCCLKTEMAKRCNVPLLHQPSPNSHLFDCFLLLLLQVDIVFKLVGADKVIQRIFGLADAEVDNF